MSRRKCLERAMVLWAAFAVAFGSLFPFLREPVLEMADVMGFDKLVDEHGSLIFNAVMAFVVLLPLLALLIRYGALPRVAQALPAPDRGVFHNNSGVRLLQAADYVGALVEFTEALRFNRGLTVTRGNRGIALFHLGRMEEAMSDLDEAIRCVSDCAVFLLFRSQIWLKKGDSDKALADCDAAITMGDRTGECSFARGIILLEQENYDRALDDINEAIQRGIRRALVYSNRGMAWLGKSEFENAIADFEEAIRLDPTEGLYFNNRGRARCQKGDYAEASADLHEAIRLTPSLPNSYKNLAWLMATCPEPEFRDGRVAVTYARRALQLTDEKRIEWFDILAAAHAEAGDFQEAIEWQMRSLAARPHSPNSDPGRRLDLYRAHRPYHEE